MKSTLKGAKYGPGGQLGSFFSWESKDQGPPTIYFGNHSSLAKTVGNIFESILFPNSIRQVKPATETLWLLRVDDSRCLETVFLLRSERVTTQLAFKTRLFGITVSIS